MDQLNTWMDDKAWCSRSWDVMACTKLAWSGMHPTAISLLYSGQWSIMSENGDKRSQSYTLHLAHYK